MAVALCAAWCTTTVEPCVAGPKRHWYTKPGGSLLPIREVSPSAAQALFAFSEKNVFY